MEDKENKNPPETSGRENEGVYSRSVAARVTDIAATAVMVLGTIYCAVLFAMGGTDVNGFLYKLSGTLISALLFVAFFVFERLSKLRIPAFLDVFLKIFIVCALVFGRTYDFYVLVPYWDKILHTVSGFLFFFAGMSVGTLVFGEKHGMSDKRFTVALCVFGLMFALAAGYVWELIEFAGDSLLGMDNQRWAEGLLSENADGTFTVTDARGTALLDTLGDMYVNFIGAAICTVACLIAFLRRPERLRKLVGFAKVKDNSDKARH